eukprot:Lithocolla_globosa_v1_NODE_257_length_4779_cov_60.829103.p3 type:complete len:172 gc:universal NODE_257_length_4779_cov_60.829103:2222-1707(-)
MCFRPPFLFACTRAFKISMTRGERFEGLIPFAVLFRFKRYSTSSFLSNLVRTIVFSLSEPTSIFPDHRRLSAPKEKRRFWWPISFASMPIAYSGPRPADLPIFFLVKFLALFCQTQTWSNGEKRICLVFQWGREYTSLCKTDSTNQKIGKKTWPSLYFPIPNVFQSCFVFL